MLHGRPPRFAHRALASFHDAVARVCDPPRAQGVSRHLRLREHDLEVADPLLEVMLALALAIAGRVFEPDFETTPIAGS